MFLLNTGMLVSYKKNSNMVKFILKIFDNLKLFLDDCIPLTLFMKKFKSLLLIMFQLYNAPNNITHHTAIN